MRAFCSLWVLGMMCPLLIGPVSALNVAWVTAVMHWVVGVWACSAWGLLVLAYWADAIEKIRADRAARRH